MDPPHLTSRSRYVPLSPPPQFLDPDRYPRPQQQQQQQHHHHQQHHRSPQQFLHPLPPNHQHHYDRVRRLPDDQRVYIQYPKPPDPPAFDRHPPPLSRVPDRVLIPEGHPSAHPHRPGRGEPFPREFLDGRAVDVDRFRVFVERPYPIQSEWKQEPRQGPMPPYRGPPYLPVDAGTSIVERKRLRWDHDHDHDRDLGEEDARRGSQRRIEFWDDQQLHLHHVHHHRHRGPTFEQAQPAPPFSVAPLSSPGRSRWPDPSFSVASISSPRDSRFGLLPNKEGRGGGVGVGGRDSSPVFERRLPPPPLHSTSHSYSDMEVLENNSALDDSDNQESHYIGNRGKRRLGGGYTKDLVRTPTKQKLSVLSRLHSGKSVWERIEERPVFLSSPSPPPHPPPPPPPSFAEEHQLEMNDLDLSYKSNAWAQSSNGKVPTVPETTPKKKVIKKKVAKKRTRVVVPIIAGSNGPTSVDGAPKRPVSTNPDQVLGQVVASPKVILSSGKPASDASPQSHPKRVVKTTSLDKSVVRKSAKKIVFSEASVSHDARGEGKAATLEEEARKYAEALLSEIISTTDNAGSHLLQEGSTAVMTSTEKNAEEQVIRVDNSVQAGDVKDIRENECITTNEKAGPNCAYPIVSEKGVRNDASSHIFIQPAILNMKSVQNGAAEGSSKAVPSLEIVIAAAPGKKTPEITEDVANSAHSDAGISISPIKGSPTSRSGFGYESPSSSGLSLKGKRGKRKREEEKQKQLAVGTVTEGLEVFGGGKSELGDPWSRSHVNGMPTVLQPEVKDNLDVTPPVGPKDEDDNGVSLSIKDVLPESDCMMLKEDSLVVPITYFMDGRMEQPLPLRHSKIDSSPIMSKVQDPLRLINTEQPYVQLSDNNGSNNDHRNYNLDEKPSNKGEPSFTSKKSFASERKGHVKSDESTLLVPAQPLLLHQPKEQINGNQTVPGDITISRKANLSYGVPRVVPNRVISTSSIKETAHSSHNMRNKTWHRNNTPPAPPLLGNLQGPFNSLMHRQSPKKLGRPHSSYIRKGNSLIRKSATEVHPPQQSHGQGVSSRINRQVTKESTCIETKASKADHVIGSNAPFERPKTPPLPFDTKIPNCSMDPPRDDPPWDLPHPISEDPSPELHVETQDRQLGSQAVDLLTANVNDPSMLICRKSEPSKAKRMVYVKHKSNQLVAAPGPELGDLSSHPTERAQKSSPFTSSDIYYRRKNNQLVLNFSSSDSQQKQDSVVSVDNSNFDDQRTSVASSLKYSTTSLFKKRADKVLRKTYRHPKFSLVWTSSGEKLHKKGVTSWNCRRVLPHLFPWKRTVYLGSSISNIASISNRRSVTLISRKLQLTRKRDTVYKVSTDGFSLRKAGVLSIGGSSLKWSKSIERHSKRASKEATLAVAEVEREKREKKIGASVGASGKKGNCLPRERVFRVGSARYRMDSSKRTLVRIPDKESSCVTGQQSGNNSRASFVPRRLLIGNDEYVRIGNGNQLVRDPKKLIRILASEKVRWSLHTARLRLARKQQYCQFFTRFGKCNKSGGKCPYIHDPAKVAICTKFLRGLCSNTNCKLTHKVLPERMPDCSYFLQGLCTNVNCPYRHVNVNPNASVCEGFLKGYCADGDECHKKHSYVCPLFEATGKCPQGSKCKLHHPRRSRNKSKKRKQPKDQSYNKGRYFGCSIIEVSEPLVVAKDNLNMDTAGDLFYSDGRFTDYICLDIGSQAHGVETSFPMNSQSAPWDSDLSDMSDDLDVIIKPVRIMNRANLTNCSVSP